MNILYSEAVTQGGYPWRDGQEICPELEGRVSLSLCPPDPWFSLSMLSQSGTLELKQFSKILTKTLPLAKNTEPVKKSRTQKMR